MKAKVFVITPKHLIIGLLVFIAVAILGYAVIPQTIAALTTPKPAEIAARDGAQAFLSTDFQEGEAVWEDKVCKSSSEQGCELVKKSIGPMLWASVEKNQVRQSCQATGSKLVKDAPADEDKLHTQVWKVTLNCVDVTSGKTNTGDIQVLVSEHEQGWQFDHILFSQENANENQ